MSSRRQMPTQLDVAREAGVSTATVSRVVNEQGAISDDVKARVLNAIDVLNYIPDAGARALAMQQSATLGAIIPTLNNAIFAEGINAFERTAQSLGYTLILSVSQQNKVKEQHLVTKMIERGVDGLMLIGNSHHPAIYDRLKQAGVRHVCTWAYDARAQAPNIGFDNVQAMEPAVEHLMSLGHVRIGMLAGITQDNDRAAGRVEGVRKSLESRGLSLPQSHIIEVPYSITESRRAFVTLMEQQKLSAVICGNDVIAYGALLEAQRLGISVPGQLSLTGFDDLSLSSELNPALTTVQVHAERMGEIAATLLIEAVESQSDVQSAQLDTKLLVRQTTGPASA